VAGVVYGSVQLDSYDLDEGNSGNDYLRIGKKIGWWLVGAQYHIASNNTGWRQGVLSLNDATNVGVVRQDADLGTSPLLQVFAFVRADSSDDFIRFRFLQNSGVSLAMNTGEGSTQRWAIFIGTHA